MSKAALPNPPAPNIMTGKSFIRYGFECMLDNTGRYGLSSVVSGLDRRRSFGRLAGNYLKSSSNLAADSA